MHQSEQSFCQFSYLPGVEVVVGTGTGVVGVGVVEGGCRVVVEGDGQICLIFFSVRVISLLESYWEPSDRRSTTSQLI